jgi:DNA-binding MarR family transcriptional regulator
MKPDSSLFDLYAPAFFARRAGKLMDKIIAQGGEYLRERDIQIPVPAISTVLSLREGPLTVTEIAGRLDVTHAAIIKLVRQLEALGLVERISLGGDARRRPIQLTKTGHVEAEKAHDFMKVAQRAYCELFDELQIDLDDALVRMDKALHKQDLTQRLRRHTPDASD